MLSRLRGTVLKGTPGELTVDVAGVGYRVTVPITTWDDLEEGMEAVLWVTTYVREDRLELFGFTDVPTRTLFEYLIEISGIGPRLGLELCAAPRHILLEVADARDGKQLTSIKGIGKKNADKLALELASLVEKEPGLFTDASGVRPSPSSSVRDPDAMAALAQLGYRTSDIIRVMEMLPKDLQSTEERVAAALKEL
jgi:Holliday junction DNA helicase RuvA